jgi:RNA polymerase sigma-70 factor (ECF subfamily)
VITDEDLLQKIAIGDSKAFESLFHRHKQIVYGLSLRLLGAKMLAEENSQEVWIKVATSSVNFANESKNSASARAWILTITKNLALNTIRKRGWEEPLEINQEMQIEFSQMDILSTIEENTNIELLKLAVKKLPDRQRVAIVLWMYDETNYKNIANEMDLSVPAVKVLLFRAKENIKKIMRDSI